MKICFVNVGDIQSIATMKRSTGMAQPLIELGHQVAIVALDSEVNKVRFQTECPDMEVLLYKQVPGFTRLKEVRDKMKLINAWKPDVVYVSSIGFRNFITKYNVNAKVVVVEHCELLSSIPQQRFRWIYRLLENSCNYLYDGMIVASRFLENYYKGKGFSIPLLYSPWGYNPATLQKVDPLILAQLKEKYANRKIILYMGRLHINYGFMEIIDVAESLVREFPDLLFLILGNGKDRSIGEQKVKEKNIEKYVSFLGYVAEEQELPNYLALADVFVSPLNDTIQDKARCPGKLFMYSCFRKPVVTCAIGEAKELFGDKGFYYEHNNISSFSNAIKKALQSSTISLVDPLLHTWSVRANQLTGWLNSNFDLV